MQDHPMVSCIMPTKDRRKFIPNAIEYFLKQTYKNKELIIIDDGFDKVKDLIPNNINIKYVYLDVEQSIGAKRNYANSIATGNIIMHWDDDDWMADEWIEIQVHALTNLKADITGIQNVFYYNLDEETSYYYSFPQSFEPWILGGSLCYYKYVWQKYPFLCINIGEDSAFLKNTKDFNIIPHTNNQCYVGIIHSRNTSFKSIKDNSYWKTINKNSMFFFPFDTFK